MIKLKNSLVRVRCLECKEEHHIDMKIISSDKFSRDIGYEYEHTYFGKLKCGKCKNKMFLNIDIFEYPKNTLNYVEISNEGCIEMDGDKFKRYDNINDSNFTICEDELLITNQLEDQKSVVRDELKKKMTKTINKFKSNKEPHIMLSNDDIISVLSSLIIDRTKK